MNEVPITYVKNFISNPDEIFKSLWNELKWKKIDEVPRLEYYSNDNDVPYSYGVPEFLRTYNPQPWHPDMVKIKQMLNTTQNTSFNVCFINAYRDLKDQLGWHADDSPEMDHSKPIAIVSLGAERDIWFKEKDKNNEKENITKLRLGNGSLCLMHPKMQLSHLHRIPKCDNQSIGKRISLTFREFITI